MYRQCIFYNECLLCLSIATMGFRRLCVFRPHDADTAHILFMAQVFSYHPVFARALTVFSALSSREPTIYTRFLFGICLACPVPWHFFGFRGSNYYYVWNANSLRDDAAYTKAAANRY